MRRLSKYYLVRSAEKIFFTQPKPQIMMGLCKKVFSALRAKLILDGPSKDYSAAAGGKKLFTEP